LNFSLPGCSGDIFAPEAQLAGREVNDASGDAVVSATIGITAADVPREASDAPAQGMMAEMCQEAEKAASASRGQAAPDEAAALGGQAAPEAAAPGGQAAPEAAVPGGQAAPDEAAIPGGQAVSDEAAEPLTQPTSQAVASQEATPSGQAVSETEIPDIPYDLMTIEQLQAVILSKLAKNGPVTDQMRRDVAENVWHNSLVNWANSF
jgi:hypothetical protein